MKRAALIATILVAALFLFNLFLRRSAASRATARLGVGSGPNPLRHAVLSRELFNGMPADSSGQLRVAVMDWGLETGTATLVAMDDGTVSLYLSSGGGVIGAGEHQAVREAAQQFRLAIDTVRSRFTEATSFDLPESNTVIFWAITGTHTHSSGPVSVADVQQPSHWLSAAGNAAQSTITQVHQVGR